MKLHKNSLLSGDFVWTFQWTLICNNQKFAYVVDSYAVSERTFSLWLGNFFPSFLINTNTRFYKTHSICSIFQAVIRIAFHCSVTFHVCLHSSIFPSQSKLSWINVKRKKWNKKKRKKERLCRSCLAITRDLFHFTKCYSMLRC